MKIAILFAGQGSQSVGMGNDLYNKYPLAKELFEKANDVLKTNIRDICFNGPEEDLKITTNTQPAILLISYICYKLLNQNGIKGEAFAGFSLGEYSALTGCEIISLEDGLRIVRDRGSLMEELVKSSNGGMAAVLGLDDSIIENVCERIEKEHNEIVVPANYNSPGQLVISGSKKGLEKAAELLVVEGAKKVVPLAVSGPFHSPFLKNGSAKLKDILSKYNFSNIDKKIIYSNVTANPHNDSELIDMLVKQMYSPVRWRKTIENLIESGFDTFIEVGPGKTLSGLLRNIDKTKVGLSVNNVETLEKTIESLN